MTSPRPRRPRRACLTLALLLASCTPTEGEDAGGSDAARLDGGGGGDGGGLDGGAPDGGGDDAGPGVDAGPIALRLVSLAAGDRVACAARDNGEVLCWGLNDHGQLGRGPGDGAFHPEAGLVRLPGGAPLRGATQVAVGGTHACARVSLGGVAKALCWGGNDRGQLGSSPSADQGAALEVAFADGSLLMGVEEVAAGGTHSCARTAAGEAYCWGEGTNGQIGQGMATPESPVTRVLGEDGVGLLEGAVAIAAHADASCALLAAAPETPFCWGRSTSCGTPAVAPRVHLSFGSALEEIRPGRSFACGRVEGGGARCVGEDALAQLGDGAPGSCSVTSHEVLGPDGAAPLSGAIALSSGEAHSCAAIADGVVCWGLGLDGRLGDGDLADSARPPTRVLGPDGAGALPPVALLAAGRGHSCAVLRGSTDADDEIYCWGEGYGVTPARVLPE